MFLVYSIMKDVEDQRSPTVNVNCQISNRTHVECLCHLIDVKAWRTHSPRLKFGFALNFRLHTHHHRYRESMNMHRGIFGGRARGRERGRGGRARGRGRGRGGPPGAGGFVPQQPLGEALGSYPARQPASTDDVADALNVHMTVLQEWTRALAVRKAKLQELLWYEAEFDRQQAQAGQAQTAGVSTASGAQDRAQLAGRSEQDDREMVHDGTASETRAQDDEIDMDVVDGEQTGTGAAQPGPVVEEKSGGGSAEPSGSRR